MSLIHQALRDMDPPLATGSAALAPRVSAAPRRHTPSRSRAPVLALVLALALAGAGYAAWRSLQGGPQLTVVGTPSAASVPAPMMATAAAATLPAAAVAAVPVLDAPRAFDAVVPAVAAAPFASAAGVAAPAVPAVLAAPVRVADAAVVPSTDPVARPPALRPRAAPPAPPAPSPARSQVQALAVVPVSRPVAPPVAIPVEQRFGLFLQAMRSHDLPTAEQHLAALRRDLPRSSVSLLRAEGWYALAQGDTDGAARHYQDILERLPGDEEASINLAGVESRRQRTEVARQILADGVRAHPESESLKSALAGFRAKP